MKIRLATRNDLTVLAQLRPFVHDLHVAAYPENFKPLTPAQAQQEFACLLEHAQSRIFLASAHGEPVGYLVALLQDRPASALLHAKSRLYVDQIAVNPSYRGQGYGKRLLEAAIALARELGLSSVELDVWAFNQHARAFFLAQGFTTLQERMALAL